MNIRSLLSREWYEGLYILSNSNTTRKARTIQRQIELRILEAGNAVEYLSVTVGGHVA